MNIFIFRFSGSGEKSDFAGGFVGKRHPFSILIFLATNDN
jgi:hypothetical protein